MTPSDLDALRHLEVRTRAFVESLAHARQHHGASMLDIADVERMLGCWLDDVERARLVGADLGSAPGGAA